MGELTNRMCPFCKSQQRLASMFRGAQIVLFCRNGHEFRLGQSLADDGTERPEGAYAWCDCCGWVDKNLRPIEVKR